MKIKKILALLMSLALLSTASIPLLTSAKTDKDEWIHEYSVQVSEPEVDGRCVAVLTDEEFLVFEAGGFDFEALIEQQEFENEWIHEHTVETYEPETEGICIATLTNEEFLVFEENGFDFDSLIEQLDSETRQRVESHNQDLYVARLVDKYAEIKDGSKVAMTFDYTFTVYYYSDNRKVHLYRKDLDRYTHNDYENSTFKSGTIYNDTGEYSENTDTVKLKKSVFTTLSEWEVYFWVEHKSNYIAVFEM